MQNLVVLASKMAKLEHFLESVQKRYGGEGEGEVAQTAFLFF